MEEIIVERKYSIPYDMFGKAFTTFQKKFVYPKAYAISLLLLVAAAANIFSIVKKESSVLGYVLTFACLALAFVNWYNPKKLKRNLMQSIKGIENDVYRLKIIPEKIIIGTVLEPDENNNKSVNEYEEVFDDVPAAEEIADTEIYLNSSVIVIEKSEYFMIYLKKSMFYIIPKKDFSEEEITVMQIHFQKQLGRNFRSEEASK